MREEYTIRGVKVKDRQNFDWLCRVGDKITTDNLFVYKGKVYYSATGLKKFGEGDYTGRRQLTIKDLVSSPDSISLYSSYFIISSHPVVVRCLCCSFSCSVRLSKIGRASCRERVLRLV